MGRVSLTVGRVRCLSVSSSSSSLDVTSDDPRHVNDVNVDVIDVISSRHKLTGDSTSFSRTPFHRKSKIGI